MTNKILIRLSRFCALSALFILAPLARAEVTALFPETYFPELEKVLRSIEGQAPELILQETNVQAAKENKDALYSFKLPRANITQTLLHRQEFRDEDPKHQTTTQPFIRARISQPIYHWGALDAQHEMGKLNELIQKGQYKEAHRLLLLTIRRHYLDIVYQKEAIRVQENHVKILQKHVETNKKQAEEGRITPEIVENSSILLDEGTLQLERLQSDLTYLQEELMRITGWPDPVEGGYIEDIVSIASTQQLKQNSPLKPYSSDTQISSFSYQNALHQLDIERENYVVIQSRVRPKVDIVGHYFRDQVESAGRSNVDRDVFEVLLSISWNVFDGWDTKHRKLESKIKQRRLRLQADLIQEQHRLESKRLQRHRELILRDIDIRERRINLSAEEKKVSEIRYDDGSITLSQFMEAVNTHNLNQLHFKRLQIDFLINSITLLSLYGEDPLSEYPY